MNGWRGAAVLLELLELLELLNRLSCSMVTGRANRAYAQQAPFIIAVRAMGKSVYASFYMVSLQNVQRRSLQSGSFVLNPSFGANLIARFATGAGMKGPGRFIIVQNTITMSHIRERVSFGDIGHLST